MGKPYPPAEARPGIPVTNDVAAGAPADATDGDVMD